MTYGESVEEYSFGEPLGEGGFARVFRARCLRSGAEVAVKRIDKAAMRARGMEARVRQEVAIHSRLRHPSVLELHAFFEDARHVYLVLELAAGGDLARHFRREPRGLGERRAADVLRQVVDAVLYLHSHRIAHRDLSPNNLLLTADGRVKIADFGLATQLSAPDEKHFTMCGTPNYISPEVASRARHGLPADIWGLGCLLYTMLAGRPPFDTRHVEQTLNRVMRADYVMPPGLSYEAQDLLERMLRKNPSERITLAEIVRHPFLNKHRNAEGPCQRSSEMSRDSGFHTTVHTTQSTQHHRTRSEERAMSSASYDALRRQRSTDRLTSQQRTRPASFNNVLTGINTDGYSSSGSGGDRSDKFPAYSNKENDTSSKLEDILPSKNRITTDDYRDCKNPELVHSNHENKENMVTGTGSIGVPPLCTTRLLEITRRTRNAELSITKDGAAMIKFINKRGRHAEDRVTEVYLVSKDGMQITIYAVKGGKGCSLNSISTYAPSSSESFSYHNLPQKHWKKYLYVARFVDLVKSKTPKVTLYTAEGKCLMMENRTDFEAIFHDGSKVSIVAPKGLKIEDKDGNVYYNSAELPEFMTSTYEHFQETMKRCLEVESALHNLSDECFPLIMGKRILSSIGSTNRSPQITPTMPNVGSINIGSFCHSTGSVSRMNEVNRELYGSESSQVKTFNPFGELFRNNNNSQPKADYSKKLNSGYLGSR